MFGDIDGDGLVDRCTSTASSVVCARGQGYGFGPAFPVDGLAGTALISDRGDLCTSAGSCVVPSP